MGRRRALGMLAALIAVSLTAGCSLSTRTPSVALDAEAPDFKLASTTGHDVSLGELLQNGPTVLVFYRGYW